MLQEYSVRYFNELSPKMSSMNFKSMLYNNKEINKLNFNNFIYSYSNLIDCLLKKFIDDLKKSDEDEMSNWKALRTLSSYAFFWSVASYITSE